MKIETAKSVHAYFDQDALKEYVEDRISQLHIALERENVIEEIYSTQGAIRELRYLLKAKDNAKAVLEQAKK